MKGNAELGARNAEWMTVRLGDVVEVNPRRGMPELTDDSVVGFVPMSAVCEKEKTIVSPETRNYKIVRKGYTPMMNGDVIIAKITPCFENGKVALVSLEQSCAFGSTEFHVFRPTGDVESRLIYHLLCTNLIQREGRNQMKGAAGQKRVPADFFRAFEFRVPRSPAAQRRIARILDAADALRAKRREALAQLDALLQSTFLTLFGDPVTNPMGMKVVRLGDIATRITDGVHQKPNYTESGIPFISVKDITTGKLRFESCKFISAEEHARYTKRCKPELYDILYTKVGATYGRPAIIDTDREFSIYVSVCLIKPRKEVVDPYFLAAAMGTSAVKRQADNRIKGIGVPDLHLDQIQNFLIPLPPLSLQRHFATIVESVERQKAAQRAHLAELDALFASLQHRAFRGEL